MEQTGPPSAPMMTPPAQPDDITDPITPPGVLNAPTPEFNAHEALLMGFCQALQKRLETWVYEHTTATMKCLDYMWDTMKKQTEARTTAHEHSSAQLSAALTALQEQGVTVLGAPYTAQVQAVSPDGYPVTLTLQKTESGALVEELGRLTGWLNSQQYTAPAFRGLDH